MKFGFKRAIEKGTVLGNDRIWGYKKESGRLVIDEEEAQVVRLIFELYANQRLGIRTISAYLADHGYENSKGNPFPSAPSGVSSATPNTRVFTAAARAANWTTN